jgi:hypothetical protein
MDARNLCSHITGPNRLTPLLWRYARASRHPPQYAGGHSRHARAVAAAHSHRRQQDTAGHSHIESRPAAHAAAMRQGHLQPELSDTHQPAIARSDPLRHNPTRPGAALLSQPYSLSCNPPSEPLREDMLDTHGGVAGPPGRGPHVPGFSAHVITDPGSCRISLPALSPLGQALQDHNGHGGLVLGLGVQNEALQGPGGHLTHSGDPAFPIRHPGTEAEEPSSSSPDRECTSSHLAAPNQHLHCQSGGLVLAHEDMHSGLADATGCQTASRLHISCLASRTHGHFESAGDASSHLENSHRPSSHHAAAAGPFSQCAGESLCSSTSLASPRPTCMPPGPTCMHAAQAKCSGQGPASSGPGGMHVAVATGTVDCDRSAAASSRYCECLGLMAPQVRDAVVHGRGITTARQGQDSRGHDRDQPDVDPHEGGHHDSHSDDAREGGNYEEQDLSAGVAHASCGMWRRGTAPKTASTACLNGRVTSAQGGALPTASAGSHAADSSVQVASGAPLFSSAAAPPASLAGVASRQAVTPSAHIAAIPVPDLSMPESLFDRAATTRAVNSQNAAGPLIGRYGVSTPPTDPLCRTLPVAVLNGEQQQHRTAAQTGAGGGVRCRSGHHSSTTRHSYTGSLERRSSAGLACTTVQVCTVLSSDLPIKRSLEGNFRSRSTSRRVKDSSGKSREGTWRCSREGCASASAAACTPGCQIMDANGMRGVESTLRTLRSLGSSSTRLGSSATRALSCRNSCGLQAPPLPHSVPSCGSGSCLQDLPWLASACHSCRSESGRAELRLRNDTGASPTAPWQVLASESSCRGLLKTSARVAGRAEEDEERLENTHDTERCRSLRLHGEGSRRFRGSPDAAQASNADGVHGQQSNGEQIQEASTAVEELVRACDVLCSGMEDGLGTLADLVQRSAAISVGESSTRARETCSRSVEFGDEVCGDRAGRECGTFCAWPRRSNGATHAPWEQDQGDQGAFGGFSDPDSWHRHWEPRAGGEEAEMRQSPLMGLGEFREHEDEASAFQATWDRPTPGREGSADGFRVFEENGRELHAPPLPTPGSACDGFLDHADPSMDSTEASVPPPHAAPLRRVQSDPTHGFLIRCRVPRESQVLHF